MAFRGMVAGYVDAAKLRSNRGDRGIDGGKRGHELGVLGEFCGAVGLLPCPHEIAGHVGFTGYNAVPSIPGRTSASVLPSPLL